MFGGSFERIRKSVKSITLSANNTTASMDVFAITGSVLIHGIWAEVTTLIGANHTAGHLRTDDGTAQIVITAAAGITLSALAVGTLIVKEALAASALTLLDNAAAKMEEPASAGVLSLSPFIVVKKTGAGTHIEYRYTTTDAPTSGVLKFHALWEPLSDDGNLAAA